MKYCPQCARKLISRNIDGASRLACPASHCNFVFWNNPVPVVAALVEHENHYLLARNRAWPRGLFSLISGYLEENESPEQAVVREVAEELGLHGQVTRHIGNYLFREKNQLLLCYAVQATGRIDTNHELAELKRLSATELAAYDFSPLYITEAVIRDWLGSAPADS